MPLLSNDTFQAEFDELTGLPTMMYFRRYAASYVHEAERTGHTAYLVYFNLKNFSSYNERYGFEEGDKLLRLVALSITDEFPGFMLSRFAEDHFFLVCQSNDVETGIMRVRACLHALGHRANVELKAGIYKTSGKTFNVGIACDRAKVACESVAHRFDRTYRWFDDALNWSMERGQYIESHIDRAVREGWIKVYFQPIVRTTTGEVCEFEALARWDDPRYGFLSPQVFVEVLERDHLIYKLDRCVLDIACKTWHKLREQTKEAVPISVNFSRLDFELMNVFEVVEKAVHDYAIPRQMLHIEITESALNENAVQLVREVDRFREAGYQVWLDDFGSGYSSLNTLKDYVFDVVKIDMAFLREFNTKPKSRVIIANIVNMAKQLGMQTLIEGVELPEQYDYVRDIGCEFVQGYLIGRPSPLDENLRRLRVGELAVAKVSLHGYYDRLGAINALSATPFDFPWDVPSNRDREIAATMPLAIVEHDAGHVNVIWSNRSFESTVRQLGMGTPSQIAANVSAGKSGQARTVLRAMRTAIMSGKTETVDLLQNDMHCALSVRFMVSRGNVNAFLVSVMNMSHFGNMGDDTRTQIAVQHLLAVYDEVNVVEMDSGLVSTAYRGNTTLPTTRRGETIVEAAKKFTNALVHPDDRERCLRYLDLATIDQRIEASGKSYLAEGFRVLGDNGSYFWLTSVLVPALVDGKRAVVVCVRKTNDSVVARMEQEDEIPKSLLWDTLLDLVPAGVFWKDRNRRFVGVNKNFLDFYSFSSVNDVLGKTDEDMGWHVDADPFKNNELRVIEQGEPVLNAHGTCIAQGEVRSILASKIPLRRSGEVVGLLGYFTDRIVESKGASSLMMDGFDQLAEIDQLTGIPNMRGLSSSAVSYQKAHASTGIDFCFIVINVCDMGNLNEVFGHSFGNRILQVVAHSLTKAAGVTGAVARMGGDKFCVIKQVRDADQAHDEASRMRAVVEGLNDVDGTYVRFRCSVGTALYSEGKDLLNMLVLADSRMRKGSGVSEHDSQ